MRVEFRCAGLLGAILLTGCAGNKEVTPPVSAGPDAAAVATNGWATTGAKFRITAESGLTGKIASVNAGLRFAVLVFPLSQMPTVGQRLNVYRNGEKVGEVKVTGPKRNENIIADIASGEAAKGDDVRER
jgi:hypothetical protein